MGHRCASEQTAGGCVPAPQGWAEIHIWAPRRLSAAQGQQHLMALGGWRNFSSACFSSKSFSVAFSACLFSSHAPMCCSSSAVDFCCASSLPVISCSGHSARTQPTGLRGSAPWSKKGFRGLGRRAPRWSREQSSLSSPWLGVSWVGFSLTQRREHCTAALAFSTSAVTWASCWIWDLVASSLEPGQKKGAGKEGGLLLLGLPGTSTPPGTHPSASPGAAGQGSPWPGHTWLAARTLVVTPSCWHLGRVALQHAHPRSSQHCPLPQLPPAHRS